MFRLIESLGHLYGFDGATLRHKRAGEHLANIKAGINAFLEGNPYMIPSDMKGERGDPRGPRFVTFAIGPDPMLSIFAGEMIYNLRSALDYTVFSLAWHDDTGKRPIGKHAEQLQFPIETHEKGFKGRRATGLKGVSDEHIALIESYQPYNGCDWTRTLRDLSNPDKHRHLIRLAGTFLYDSGHEYRAEIDWAETKTDQHVFPVDAVDVKFYATLDVTFVDGALVAQTLEELQTQVGNLLDVFEGEFKFLSLD